MPIFNVLITYTFMVGIGLLTSCTQHRSILSMVEPEDREKSQTASFVVLPDPELVVHPTACTVVLLHGLFAPVEELEPIANKINCVLGDQVKVIQPKCRDGKKSCSQSIAKQAKAIFEELKTELGDQLDTFPLIIIGYSQGGVVGCTLAANYAKELNIKGIVTLNAPIKGTSVLQQGPQATLKFLQQAQEGLRLINGPTSLRGRLKMIGTALGITALRKLTPSRVGAGGKDILPGSECLDKVNRWIRQNDDHVPLLFIGSYYNDFGKLFDVTDASMTTLSSEYAKLITAGEAINNLHDTLIPTCSQLGRGDSLEDLHSIVKDAPESEDPITRVKIPGQPLVETCLYKEITHAANLIALDPNLFVPDNTQVVVTSKEMQKKIIEFIQEKVPPLKQEQ